MALWLVQLQGSFLRYVEDKLVTVIVTLSENEFCSIFSEEREAIPERVVVRLNVTAACIFISVTERALFM